MTYAGERTIYDADSHLMELPDFLSAHANRKIKDRLPKLQDIDAAGQRQGWTQR